MYAKIIDEQIVFAPKIIERIVNGVSYTTLNPTDAMLAEQGWLPVVYTEMPDDPPLGYDYLATYTEENGEIVQDWELVETELSDAEALSVITGGAL